MVNISPISISTLPIIYIDLIVVFIQGHLHDLYCHDCYLFSWVMMELLLALLQLCEKCPSESLHMPSLVCVAVPLGLQHSPWNCERVPLGLGQVFKT